MSVRRRKIASRLFRDAALHERVKTVPVGTGFDCHISRMGKYLTWLALRAVAP